MDRVEWQAQQRALRVAVARERGLRLASARAAPPPPATPACGTLVSVIVAAWNAEATIARCIGQLLAQDYAPYEILVVDDGSSDETLRVARELAGSANSLRVICNARNRGLARARNVGLDESRGEMVAFIDADGFADPGWLTALVRAFATAETVGAVASTVFVDANPIVVNGAGGTVNRQGWAADLAMGGSYEDTELPREALYAMGCGMALRRSTIERVGRFDESIRNYYDDVDYGVRVWRAGLRLTVAEDAWVDHGWAGGTGSDRQALLCERHRMRLVLKHADAQSLTRWAREEVRSLRDAPQPRRRLKLRAAAWNAWHGASTVAARRRLRRLPPPPDELLDGSWGDGFPVGLPLVGKPQPDQAGSRIDMSEAASEAQLIYGWFPRERVDGRCHRWAAHRAAAVMRVQKRARRLRLDYAHPPADTGGIDVLVRRLEKGADPLREAWSAHLPWQYVARAVENHPIDLLAGEYEIVLRARHPFSGPKDSRRLGCAVTSLSLHERFDVGAGGLDMASPAAEEQLAGGWFELERCPQAAFRWAAGRAAAVVRLEKRARSLSLHYRLPPVETRARIGVGRLDGGPALWSCDLQWFDDAWRNERFALDLAPGRYVFTVEADAPWSNPGQRKPELWAENRSLALALSSLDFHPGA